MNPHRPSRLPCLLATLLLLPAPGALAAAGVAGHGPAAADAEPTLVARRGERGGGHRRGRTGLGRSARGLDRGDRRPSGGWARSIGGERRSLGDRFDRDRTRSRLAELDRDRVGRGLARVDRDRVRRSFEGIDRDRIRSRYERIDRDDLRRAREDWRDSRGRVEDNWRDARERARDDWRDARERVENRWDDRWDDRWNRVDRAIDRVDDWNDHWPGWVRPGWAVARPWRWGWYGGWSRPPWGWWGTSSVAWGIGTLATATVINDAVNAAIAARRTTIVVPGGGYTLYYNSVQPSGEAGVTFQASTGQTIFSAGADCRRGDLNGRPPASPAQAELLNAACQVAYGGEAGA